MNALPGREYDLIQFSLVNDNKMYSQIKFVRTPGHENVKYCTGKDAVKMSADINIISYGCERYYKSIYKREDSYKCKRFIYIKIFV